MGQRSSLSRRGHLGTRALKKKTPQKRGASPRFSVCQDSSGIGGIGKPSSPPCIGRYGDRGHADVMAVTKSAISAGDAVFSGTG